MSCSGKDDSQDEECSRKDNSSASPDLVYYHSHEEHSEDLSNQIGVGKTGLDGTGHAVFVKIGEEWLPVYGQTKT